MLWYLDLLGGEDVSHIEFKKGGGIPYTAHGAQIPLPTPLFLKYKTYTFLSIFDVHTDDLYPTCNVDSTQTYIM